MRIARVLRPVHTLTVFAGTAIYLVPCECISDTLGSASSLLMINVQALACLAQKFVCRAQALVRIEVWTRHMRVMRITKNTQSTDSSAHWVNSISGCIVCALLYCLQSLPLRKSRREENTRIPLSHCNSKCEFRPPDRRVRCTWSYAFSNAKRREACRTERDARFERLFQSTRINRYAIVSRDSLTFAAIVLYSYYC